METVANHPALRKYQGLMQKLDSLMADLEKSPLAKLNELKKEGAKTELKCFVWLIMRNLTPWSLLAREEGVSKKEVSLDTGFRKRDVEKGQTSLVAAKNLRNDCCLWQQVQPVRQTTYKLVLRGIQLDYDFTVSHLDLQQLLKLYSMAIKLMMGQVAGEVGLGWIKWIFRGATLVHAGGMVKDGIDAMSKLNAKQLDTLLKVTGYGWEKVDTGAILENIASLAWNNKSNIVKLVTGHYAVHLKGKMFYPVEFCWVPDDTSISLDKKDLGRYPCSATPVQVSNWLSQGITDACVKMEETGKGPSGKPKLKVSIIDVIPQSGNNPFDPQDPLKTGGETKTTSSTPPCNAGPTAFPPIGDNPDTFLNLGYDPATGACTIGQLTGTDILEFHVRSSGDFSDTFVRDALSQEFFFDGNPIPSSNCSVFNNITTCSLSFNVETTINMVQQRTGDKFSGIFIVGKDGSTFTLQVINFQKVR